MTDFLFHQKYSLFTFRITAIAAEITARRVFELSLAFGTFTDQIRHLRRFRVSRNVCGFSRHFADLSFRLRKMFQTAVN